MADQSPVQGARTEGVPATRDDLLRLEAVLAEAMTSATPQAVIDDFAGRSDCPGSIREALAAIDADGLRMTRLLVAKLRFQRLMHGSKRAGLLYSEDPARFAAAFRRYNRDVLMTAHEPRGEAALFEAWFAAANADA